MRKIIFTGISLIFVIIQIWFLHLTFTFPVSGIIVQQNKDQSWVLERFDSTNFSSQVNLKAGDIILYVDNIPADEYPTIKRWRNIDQSGTITVVRDGKTIEVDTSQAKLPLNSDVLAIFAEAFSLFIAYLLYKKSNNSKSALYLSAVFLDISLTFMSLGASLRGDLLGKACISTLMILLPIVFYHFIAAFLFEKGYIQMPVAFLKWAYLSAIGVFVSHGSFLFPSSAAYYFYQFMTLVTLSITVLGMLSNVAILCITYYKHRKEKTYASVILKTVIVSLILSLSPIIVFSFIPQILFHRDWINSFYASWFIFIFPLTFAYLIVAKRLYDIDMVMRRILFTGLIALFPSLLMTGLIRFLFPNDSTGERLALVFMFLAATLTFILYSLENLTTKLEPVMFPRKYRLKDSLKKIAKNMGSISSLRGMKDIVLVDIISTLDVNGGAIIFRYKEHTEWISEGLFELAEAERFIAGQHGYDSGYTFIEITRNEEYTSYLIIAERKNRSRLNTEERQWLNLIVTYLAVCLENIHLLRKLTVKLEQFAAQIPDEKVAVDMAWFRKLMFDLQEKERFRIATDLHDTTMQDLFFLKDRLRSLLEKYSFYREDRASIESLMDYIDIINTNLRQSCFELHPHLLKEIGLVQTIHKLVEIESIANPFDVDVSISGTRYLEKLDLDTKRHLFRLIQELINNAKKHSQASRIRFTLNAGTAGIYMDYEDDGVGFEPKMAAPGEIGGNGIGLEQMKSRILSIGGIYDLKAAVGSGMKLSVSFPAKEDRTA